MLTSIVGKWRSKRPQQVIKIDACASTKMVLDEFYARQKVAPESQMSKTLADKVKIVAIFHWGRRERWCAGEEKKEGLLRTVDCVFKSWLLITFSIIVQAFPVRNLARRSAGGG